MSTVLLVEDNLLLCKMEARHISAAFPRASLYTAHTSEEALAAASAHPPDAVVMDCRLPGCGCLGLMDAILEISPDAAIIIASADPPKELTKRKYREKIFGVLEKPFETEELVDVLQRAISKDEGGRVAPVPFVTDDDDEEQEPAASVEKVFDRHGMLNTLTGLMVAVRGLESELSEADNVPASVRETVDAYVPKIVQLVHRATAHIK